MVEGGGQVSIGLKIPQTMNRREGEITIRISSNLTKNGKEKSTNKRWTPHRREIVQ